MHPFIPEEIVATILTNLPADSLARCKCVSKQWCRLISETNTKHKLLTKSILRGEEFFSFIDQETLEVEDVDIPWEDREHARFYGSCDGLLLVALSDDLFLWNPSISYHQKILSYEDISRYRMFGGICFDLIKKEYKVVVYLRIMSYGGREFAMVGSPRDKSWTHVHFPYSEVHSGPVLNNHVHWLVHMKDSRPLDLSLVIYFDTKTDKFVEFPTPLRHKGEGYFILGFGVLDGCLSISCTEETFCSTVQVMAMKVYGVRETWTVLFRIEYFCWPECVVPYFYLDENKSEVLMKSDDLIYVHDINSNSKSDSVSLSIIHYEVVYEETSVRPIGYDWEELDSRGEAFYVEKFLSGSQRTMKKDSNGDWYAEEDDESEEDGQERVI